MMHQSSCRILRWTEDDRPYTKDFLDLFCTLMVALPLEQHIQLFSKYPFSFTTREALGHLGNLKFTQTNKRPSPDNPEIMVTTKVATTFSMVESMARTLCTKFLSARLIEQVGAQFARDDDFSSMSSIWQMTPKGIKVLEGFVHRNGVVNDKIPSILKSPRNSMNLLVLERKAEQDDLKLDPGTIDVIFKRFAGPTSPVANSASSVHSDSDSIDESTTGLTGVKQTLRKVSGARHPVHLFSGKQTIDWLMNCCTLVDVREAGHIARAMLDHGLIALRSVEKKQQTQQSQSLQHQLHYLNGELVFNSSKNAWYDVTDDGKRVVRWLAGRAAFQDVLAASQEHDVLASSKDTNSRRLNTIIMTPGLLLYFREYLVETHCEENLHFTLEAKAFLTRWGAVIETCKENGADVGADTLNEILAAAYDLYNAFLAPGSPCELNIEHALRNALVTKMSQFNLPDGEKMPAVVSLLPLYEGALCSVSKLMATDSIPKFLRDQRFRSHLAEHNLLDPIKGSCHPLQATTMQVQAINT